MALRFTLRQLEYLVAVGEAGSIAQAAVALNVSSPSISAAIAQLEAELAVQLFVRHHAQGLRLTPGGQRVVNAARRILADAAALADLAGDIRGQARGTVTAGALVTLAPLVSAALRRSFETAFPEATASFREGHQAGLIEMLRRAEIDVALTYDLEIPADLSFAGLAALPPFVMLPAAHPLAGRGGVALAELADEPMVLLDLPLSREYFLSMFHAEGLRPRIAARTAEASVLRSLVANGFGYGLMNLRTRLRLAPDGGQLAFLRLEGDHRPMVLGLARMKGAHVPRVVAAFCDHVAARIGAGDIPGIESGR
jgi:DNA-binding transcriptional LysR family regulator